MNYISQIAAFITAVVLLFVVPAYRMSWVVDQAVLKQVGYETQEFVNAIRHKGFISRESYEGFVTGLSKTGNVYDIQLKHTRKVYYPLKPGDPDYSPTHTYTIVNDEYYTKQILDTLYINHNDYLMKKGDSFTVTVTNNSRTGSMVFLSFMGGAPETSMIFSKYGGMIVNEDYSD
ncbi:MAG: hypothetical protein FIA99_07165 [Ruminiclostridium sp.]|nr:hypothetical protein [Ruminiclostridium sp.]